MKVSVVLPAYKARFLRESIDSILTQSYKSFELIIVNDASPEDISSIVKSYDDNRIRYYENAKNIGGHSLVKNWNHCIDYATGDYLVLASDDDKYHPDFLLKMIELSEKYPTIDVFHTRIGIIDESDAIVNWSQSIAEYETDIDFIYQRAINRRPQVVSDFMIRISALKKMGGFIDYPSAWYSDEMTYNKLSKSKGAVCSAETLFFWRVSSLNISSKSDDILEKASASYFYYSQMQEFLSELNPSCAKDEYFLTAIKSRLKRVVAQQLIWDMSKANYKQRRAVLSDKNIKQTFLKGKLRYKLAIEILRNKLHF